ISRRPTSSLSLPRMANSDARSARSRAAKEPSRVSPSLLQGVSVGSSCMGLMIPFHTPGGRLKIRRRIGELERALGVEGTELVRQEQAGTLPAERDRLELAMMVQAYDTERRLIQSQGAILGTPAVTLEEQGEDVGPDTPP